jgi:DNA-binding NarL/FixJ family response regulator
VIRIVIADDQELVRNGIRMILEGEPDHVVVGESGDGAGAVELVSRERPDVVLLDVQMPGQDGLGAAREILADERAPRVLMLTTFDLDEYVYEALRAGACGFLLKDMPGEDIVTAVRQAARGGDALLAPAVTRRLIARFTASGPPPRPDARAVTDLTDRDLRLRGRTRRRPAVRRLTRRGRDAAAGRESAATTLNAWR